MRSHRGYLLLEIQDSRRFPYPKDHLRKTGFQSAYANNLQAKVPTIPFAAAKARTYLGSCVQDFNEWL